MKEITITELKKLTAQEIGQSECLKVLSDGETIAYVVVKPEGEMRIRVEGIISQIDASRGF